MLTIVDIDGRYSVQFGKSDFASNINAMFKQNSYCYALVLTDNAMFGLSSSDEYVLLDIFDKSGNINSSDITYPQVSFEKVGTVFAEEASFGDTLLTKYSALGSGNSSKSVEQKSLSVPIVPNGSTPLYPNGFCWASSASSVIKYRKSLAMTSIQLRDSLISSGSYVGYDYQIQNIMQSYIGGTITLNSGTGMLSYNSIKTIINANKPIYTDWQASSSAHAMVVAGYYYNSSIAIPYCNRVTLMDPNYSTYQSFTLSSTNAYRIGTTNYYWYSSVY